MKFVQLIDKAIYHSNICHKLQSIRMIPEMRNFNSIYSIALYCMCNKNESRLHTVAHSSSMRSADAFPVCAESNCFDCLPLAKMHACNPQYVCVSVCIRPKHERNTCVAYDFCYLIRSAFVVDGVPVTLTFFGNVLDSDFFHGPLGSYNIVVNMVRNMSILLLTFSYLCVYYN